MRELPEANISQSMQIRELTTDIFYAFVSRSFCQSMKVSHVRDLAQDAAEIFVGAELQ